MGKTSNKTQKSMEDRRKKKRETERKRRENIKNNPDLYEEAKQKERERYHKRKQEGKIVTIDELSSRERRKKRKMWKQSAKKYRENHKKSENVANSCENSFRNSPTALPNSGHCPSTSSATKNISGRKKIRKDRAKAYRTISKLEKELTKYKSKYNKFKTRYYRAVEKQKQNVDSPNTNAKNLLSGQTVTENVRRKLIFNEALLAQMKENVKKKNLRKCKHLFVGKILKKYRCMKYMKDVFSYKVLRSPGKKTSPSKVGTLVSIKRDVELFLEEDECSRLCPGKKDTITRHGNKKQKRYLNNSLLNLHKQFSAKHTEYTVSYSTFCKLRPFWIVPAKATERDTCVCMLHENVRLLVSKLHKLDIIAQHTSDSLCKSLCCNEEQITEKCLERKCADCKEKKILFSNFQKENTVTYEKWILKKEVIVFGGKTKTCTKYRKESLQCSLGCLVSELEAIFPKFMSHVNNICHQHREMSSLKQNLPPNSAVVHMDFSENYNCKFSQEIQAFHFGGSREQVSIHTVMVYLKNETSEIPIKKAYCTLSDSLRHDPVAIMAHLQPIFTEIKQLVPSITSLHFVSDGPSTQYRNRTMFALIGTYIVNCFPAAESITWNYSESGHGKGAPDGLGGTLKRTADYLVAQGKDVSNFSQLSHMLKDNVKGITVISVPKKCIEQLSNTLDLQTPKPFKGTLKVHQVTWARNEANSRIHFRRLSCFRCHPLHCSHYDIGYLDISNNDEKPADITPCILFKTVFVIVVID